MEEFKALLEQHRQSYVIEDRYFKRAQYFFHNFGKEPNYGLGHSLFALYASFPILLTPDLLHQLRFNFKNYHFGGYDLSIQPIVVSDFLMSGLCREVAHHTYEIPSPLRFFLFSLLQKLLDNQELLSGLVLSDDQMARLADFINFYALQNPESTNAFGQAAQKAQQLNAQILLNPAQGLASIARELSNAAGNQQFQYQLSLLTEQVLSTVKTQEQANSVDAKHGAIGSQLNLLLTYTKALKKFYLEGRTAAVEEGLSGLVEKYGVLAMAEVDPILLPVPVGALDVKEKRIKEEGFKEDAVRRRFNPYIVGPPITSPEDFYGRENILRQIHDGIHNNIYFIRGPRRIGKTSLLYQLKHLLETTNDSDYVFFPVMVDLQGLQHQDFLIMLMRRIIQSLDLIDHIVLPVLEALYDSYQFLDDLEAVLKVLESRSNSSKFCRLVILIDEIQMIDNFNPLTPSLLRWILLEEYRIKLIMAGVNLFKQVVSQTSSPFNIHLELTLGPLKESEAKQLIIEPVRWIYTYAPDAIDLIIKESNCEPMQIQRICFQAISYKLDSRSKNIDKITMISREDIINAVNKRDNKVSSKSTNIINPYIVGAAISNSTSFYGRRDLVDFLKKPISSAYYIRGSRRIGKTSLLRFIQQELEDAKSSFAVYFSLQGYRDVKNLNKGFATALKKAYKNAGIELINHPEDFFYACKESVERMQLLKRHYFLLIDEAEVLIEFRDTVRSILNSEFLFNHDNLTIIACGAFQIKHFDNEKIGADGLSNFFKGINIGGLDREGAEELIRQVRQPSGEIQVDQELINDILNHAGTQPYFIQYLCHNLFTKGGLRPIKTTDFILGDQFSRIIGDNIRRLEKSQQFILEQFIWEKALFPENINSIPETDLEADLVQLKQLSFLKESDGAFMLDNYFLAQYLEKQKPSAKPKRMKIFISYSNKDEAFRDELELHLKRIDRTNELEIFSDRNILPGEKWDKAIKSQIQQAQVILLLVSADFLASEYIINEGLRLVMKKHERGETKVVPIIIRSCDWGDTALGKLQALPASAKPIGSINNDEVWVNVANSIRRLIETM